jgi:hypothetical protein
MERLNQFTAAPEGYAALRKVEDTFANADWSPAWSHL